MEGQSDSSFSDVSTGSKVQELKKRNPAEKGKKRRVKRIKKHRKDQRRKTRTHTKKNSRGDEVAGVVRTFNVTDEPLSMDSDDAFEEHVSGSTGTDSPPPPSPPESSSKKGRGNLHINQKIPRQ